MNAGQGLWNLAAILHYLERKNSTNSNLLKLIGLGQESCRSLSQAIGVALPGSAELAQYMDHFEHKYMPAVPTAGTDSPDESGKAWEDAIDLCDSILTRLEFVSCERAEDFVESVSEKVRSMREWIKRNEHVTEKMEMSLENMSNAVAKWEER